MVNNILNSVNSLASLKVHVRKFVSCHKLSPSFFCHISGVVTSSADNDGDDVDQYGNRTRGSEV